MRRRFWFDDGGDNSRIERFVKEYKCEIGMTNFFKVEYVKENYSKALKKLNEINKCFVEACNIVEQIKNVEDKSRNNQSKK